MASGDTLFTLGARDTMPPGTLYATLDTVSDASTPTITFDVLDFSGGGTNEHADYLVKVPSHYAGTTGFTFQYSYAPDGSAGGTTEFEARVLKVADLDVLTGDLGMDGLTAATLTDTAPSTPTNKFNETATVALAKGDMSAEPAAGDFVVIRITRDTATDSNTDDAQVKFVYVTET